jgi:hypothetical protein
MPEPGAIVAPVRGLLPQQRDSWLHPWVLYPAGAVCFLVMLISTGIVSQHLASSSFITMSGGQSYSIQIGETSSKSSPATMTNSQAHEIRNEIPSRNKKGRKEA